MNLKNIKQKITDNINIFYYSLCLFLIIFFLFYRFSYMPKFKYIHEAQYSVTIAFFEKFKNTIIFYFIFYLIILLNLFILLAFSNIIRLIKNYTGKIFYIIIFPLFISILSYLLKFSLFIIKLKSFNSLYYYYSIFEDNIYFTSYFIIIL